LLFYKCLDNLWKEECSQAYRSLDVEQIQTKSIYKEYPSHSNAALHYSKDNSYLLYRSYLPKYDDLSLSLLAAKPFE
jgi:hypothetical protein